MNSFYKYFLGSTRYSVNCSCPAKVAGQLMSSFPETVYDVNVVDDYSFEFSCLLFLKKKIINSDVLIDADVKKVSSYGLPFIILKKKKRYGLLVGAIVFSLVVYLQSFIVWEMRISGNNNISDVEIKQTLANLGFKEGSIIMPSKLSEIQNRFLLSEERISWISINMSGTVAFVEVKERNLKGEGAEIPSMSGILSSKDCIVELCEVTSGTSLVSAGDTVEKGQMLISPLALGKDGNEYLAGACGRILARTYEEFSVTVQYISQRASFTGNENITFEVSFLGKSIIVREPDLLRLENYICTKNQDKIKLFEGVILPMDKTTTKKLEYIISEEIITPAQARKRAYNKIYSKISNELPDAEILSTTFSEVENDDSFVLRCRVECIRDVARRVEE